MKENIKRIRETMTPSIFEVFEKMFYVFLEPLDIRYDEYGMEAAISFEGTISGDVRILFSREIVRAMVQNMLGLEGDEIAVQDMEDCSKEAVNMVCGNFLSRFDSTKVFNLSAPTFKESQPECFESGEDICRMDFDSDNGKVGVVVKI
ncbi:MAG: chemotaxis protein CheX [Deltaproteobacteria bacterium]|nr:chemotaxis protein CheX [Deltaproteobacteria bacterium]